MFTNWKVTAVPADKAQVAAARQRSFIGLTGGNRTWNIKSLLLASSITLASMNGASAENYRSLAWLPAAETTTSIPQWYVDEIAKVTTARSFPAGCIKNKMDEEDLTQLIIDNIYETLNPPPTR
jgi:hypothetical protein